MAEPGRPFSLKTLADYWGVTPETVRQRILDGSLKAFRVGRAYMHTRQHGLVFFFQDIASTGQGASQAEVFKHDILTQL